MMRRGFSRRDFLKTAGAFTAMTAIGEFPAEVFADERKMVRFPEKTDLIVLTQRPVQLETPLHYFKELITPNKALFVRWHISQLPTSVDLNLWRLRVGGNTEKELALSMDDLKQFEKVSYTAVIQCSGNGRSFFEPWVAGGQWKNGAMGNVTFAGARLRDILNKAGIKAGSVDVSFDGLDRAPLPSVPDFVKSLPVDKALEDDILVAYEMNGEYMPLLNGFPARLVVPGWYATYWVKGLTDITVLPKQFEGFWVKTAYRIPDTACGCIPPGSAPKKTIPINRMTTRSLIIDPSVQAQLKAKKPVEIMGIAFSGGYSIREVIVSVDKGKTWKEARLGQDKGRYSWIQWFFPWKPDTPGKYTLMARATNSIGESQPFESLWNPAGYLWNKIEKVEVMVT
ncbi:MAG: molybdopterin-dependent oxidoreductase [Nitrospirae bacterium]|nr:molybdopterin-dependent oxidoreductase [Nitrospirota bacterium]MCL5422294.1 molybdopterin-dependent oxidoreductase [Nitrospirota bacterium]